MKNKKRFCDVIVSLREKKKLSINDLAKKTGVSTSDIRDWEAGYSFPDIATVSILADTLGVNSSYLVNLCKNEYVSNKKDILYFSYLLLTAVGIAMAISAIALSILNSSDFPDIFILLGISIISLCLSFLCKR